jgi:type II secretory pathway pseudopilin PulG
MRTIDEGGYTLTEVLVALFLMAAVSAVFLPVMESTLVATRDFGSAARTNDAARLAIAELDRKFRAAERVCLPDPGTTGDTLSFRTRAYTATTTASGYQDLVYQLNGTRLQVSTDGGTTWRTIIEGVENAARGVPIFQTEGGVASQYPSEGKVVTVSLWVDADPNDRLSARLMTTELSGRNIWSPNAPNC